MRASIQGGVVIELFEEFVQIEFPGTPTEENPSPAPVVRAVPLAERFHPDFVAALAAVPAGAVVALGDSYDGKSFGPPPQPPVLTADQVLAQRDGLLANASLRIAPLQDAVDLDEATAVELAALKAWKQYRVALSRVDQQAGFPIAVDWPKAPR
ncbi:MAG: tail fiber assembly protein [Variovorax sp.]|nr:tail fiber assembly protein [Variovorax sp.]